MNNIIKKISHIRRLAIFNNFNWDDSVREQNSNNIPEFKKINIIYGRNYSGKTTLSRIFRAFETGIISDRYDSPEFAFTLDDKSTIDQESLNNNNRRLLIRVFNKDFVKDNLHFIIDDTQTIKSFAILGEDNTTIESKIAELEIEIGNLEQKSGLQGELILVEEAAKSAKQTYENKKNELENKLRRKANNPTIGIKHNKLFGDATYDITKIRRDIEEVSKENYSQLEDEKSAEYRTLLKEEPKENINSIASFNLKYITLASDAKNLIEKDIKGSNPIKELLDNNKLENWVREGRELHEKKRNNCAFCGNELPFDLWEKLNLHFNQESENLRLDIDKLIDLIEEEKKRTPNLLNIDSSKFYTQFNKDLEILKSKFLSNSNSYIEMLDNIKLQLEDRKNNIFSTGVFSELHNKETDLDSLWQEYENCRNESNNLSLSLNDNQSKARNALRLNEVYCFVQDIGYHSEMDLIRDLQSKKDEAQKSKDMIIDKIRSKQSEINVLKSELKDESKGAQRVNEYLTNFFGHKFLSLEAIKETSDSGLPQYRFQVVRNNKQAFDLSEGECSLIAFCYFMARLEDVETDGNQPIIWIDDPISSLDVNHIFFVYSLIKTKIIAPRESGINGDVSDRYKQLFISTHSLDFLKYLNRLKKPNKQNKFCEYFMLTRTEQNSTIRLMPKYLKDNITEFNYLFEQIYKCAHANIENDDEYECYYNFGNNARKFLEVFLFYKYPDGEDKESKLNKFFAGNAIAASLTDRLNNEYSHLVGLLERSVIPIDKPEMKSVAQFILEKIKEKDQDQYAALVRSIEKQ